MSQPPSGANASGHVANSDTGNLLFQYTSGFTYVLSGADTVASDSGIGLLIAKAGRWHFTGYIRTFLVLSAGAAYVTLYARDVTAGLDLSGSAARSQTTPQFSAGLNTQIFDYIPINFSYQVPVDNSQINIWAARNKYISAIYVVSQLYTDSQGFHALSATRTG